MRAAFFASPSRNAAMFALIAPLPRGDAAAIVGLGDTDRAPLRDAAGWRRDELGAGRDACFDAAPGVSWLDFVARSGVPVAGEIGTYDVTARSPPCFRSERGAPRE